MVDTGCAGANMADGCDILEQQLADPGSVVRLFRHGEAVDAIMKIISEAEADVVEAKPDGTSLLHSFAILGCYDLVKLLWEKGAQPTILKIDDSTVLHSVVRAQDDSQDTDRARILELFLSSDECGGNSMPLDHQNSKGWTALKLAARKNLEKCVEVLLEHGADPDVVDVEQYTALHNSVSNPDILKLLLTKTKNVNMQNQDGETALYLAAERGLTGSALTLLEYGADPNIPNKEGIAPLFLAARGGFLELVKALTKKGADVNSLGASQGISALHWAAHKEHEDVALFLIENGGDISLLDKEGRTPLSMASPELVTKMIARARKMNPQLTLPTDVPPMSAEEKAMAACCGGNVQALQALLQSGVSVNHASGSTMASLLHMAAYCGQLPVLLFLMRSGANWKAVDEEGDTVLHFACMKEVSHGLHDKTLEFLLATPIASLKNAQNVRGDTPINVATRCQFVTRVKMLLRCKADVTIANTKKELPLHRACGSDKNMEALLYFTELSPDINAQDTDGWSPLMYAAKASASATVKYLLQRGADPNIRQMDGFTALYLAAQEDNASICQELLEAGADPLLVGGPQQLSPLHIAAHRGSRAVCLVLIEHGADIHLADADGDTPLMLAEDTEFKQAMMMSYECHQSTRGDSNEPTTPDNQNVLCNEKVSSAEEPAEESKGSLQRQGTFSKEQEKEDHQTAELLEKLQSQSKRLLELEWELGCVRSDKEMLLSRSKCQEDELQELRATATVTNKMMGVSLLDNDSTHTHTHTHHHWWAVDASEYEVTGQQVNIAKCLSGKFFDVFPGRYRCMPVAVKQVRNMEQWTKDVFWVFLREVEILSQLQCPCVVQFLGATIDCQHKACAILTEYMARKSLDVVLHVKKTPLDWNTRLRIVKDVCCGMAYLHSHQILHRYLVPTNILVGEHFNAKISDFGLFETKKQSQFCARLRAICTGPQVYMAPEAMERFEFTTAADVYSFGIIMSEVATGQKPFADMGLSCVVLVSKLVTGLRPSFDDRVPQEYQKVTKMCWHEDPNLRPVFKLVQTELSKM